MLKLLKYLKEYRNLAILSVLLIIAQDLLQIYIPTLTAKMVSYGVEAGNVPEILRIGGIMLLVSLFNGGVSILNSYCTSKTSSGYGKTMRMAIFKKISILSQSDIDKIGVPSLITRTTNDVTSVQSTVLSILRNVITVPIMFIGGLAMAMSYNKKMTLIILLVAAPLLVVIMLLLAKVFMPWFKLMQERTDKVNQVMREKLGGIRVIRAFNRSNDEDARFRQANLDLTSIALKIQRLFAFMMPVMTILVFGLLVGLIWNTGNNLDALNPAIEAEAKLIGETVGNMYAYIAYIAIMISAIGTATSFIVGIPKAQVSAKRIIEVLKLEPDVKEAENPVLPMEELAGQLEFCDVSFSYPKAEEGVINNISFCSKPGEVTAIIGGTGCGKSTLVSLIPRMYDVSEGTIKLGGVDIRNIPIDVLHSKIAYIPQKAFLFSGTIADNLRYGKMDATPEEMDRALEIAQAKYFVSKMSDGIDSMISQSATNLSGGQKQRLAIARAIIKNADICIFDDSFSALDLATDAKLRAAIKENMKNTNIIIVAQRIGTVLNANRIIVLDEGNVVGMGKHDELLETCETYREIFISQLSEEEAEI